MLDDARLLTDDVLSASSVSASLVDVIEQRVADYIMMYPMTPPLTVLGAISTDIVEVQGLARQREPAATQARLSAVTAVLALLSADALMKLGDVNRARYWYGTARLAADDTLNPELQARVRAQEAMLPYYFGQVQQTVTLARAAQSFVSKPCSAKALGAAAEARALARLGYRDEAEQAMNRARHVVDHLGDTPSDAAFEFNEKRLLLYLSGTLTYMGEYERAYRVQDEALELYRHDSSVVIDPALIALDRAVGHAASGHAQDGCQLATATLDRLPAEHRTKIVLARAADVVHSIPAGRRQTPAAMELRELIAEQTGTS